jgi:ABC-type sugar transport system permease subunit
VVTVGLIYYCVGDTAVISTLDWDGVSPNPTHVGTANFVKLFHDRIFWMALRHTIIFFVATFVCEVVLGIVFATILHSKIRAGALYKVIIFVPVVIAPATMAPVFRQIFSPTGQFNSVLSTVGLGFLRQPWLAQDSTALPVIIAISVWQATGISFILYFAAMSQVDLETIEAARIDGAGNLGVLWHIILPDVRGTTIALAMLSAIAALKTFDIPYLVSQGGPNYATEFLGTFIYRESVPLSAVGYAAALSIMLLLLAVTMAIVLNVSARERGPRRV